MMSKDEKWNLFRQFLFNELGITRDVIRGWTEDAVRDVAETHVRHYLSHENIDATVRGILVKQQAGSAFPRLDDVIKQEAVRQIMSKYNVEVTKIEPKDGE